MCPTEPQDKIVSTESGKKELACITTDNCRCWSCSQILAALSRTDVGIEELREKRDEVKKLLQAEEEEKARIQKDMLILTKRLAEIDDSLTRKYAYSKEYDKTIFEVEEAYSKVCCFSFVSLHVCAIWDKNFEPKMSSL